MELKLTLKRIVPQTRIILSHQNRNFNTLPDSTGPPPSTSPATMNESSSRARQQTRCQSSGQARPRALR